MTDQPEVFRGPGPHTLKHQAHGPGEYEASVTVILPDGTEIESEPVRFTIKPPAKKS